MAIADLLRVVASPNQPVEQGDAEQWTAVQEALGTSLPGDYRDFGQVYGSGYFGTRMLEVLNPFSIDFLGMLSGQCNWLREVRGLGRRSNVPYGVFPDQPGWFPWGHDPNGHWYCWLTQGEPDEWPIILLADNYSSFQQLEMSLTSFLAGFLSDQLVTILSDPQAENGLMPEHYVAKKPRGGSKSRRFRMSRHLHPPHIEWLEPDRHGRPIGARAVLGPRYRSMPYEPFTVCPSWWAELPAPPQQWVRHHLLGWRFGGPGQSAFHNLIPTTRITHRILCALEVTIAIEAMHDPVICTVRAEYAGARNRYPAQISIEAHPAPGSNGSFTFQCSPIKNYPY